MRLRAAFAAFCDPSLVRAATASPPFPERRRAHWQDDVADELEGVANAIRGRQALVESESRHVMGGVLRREFVVVYTPWTERHETEEQS